MKVKDKVVIDPAGHYNTNLKLATIERETKTQFVVDGQKFYKDGHYAVSPGWSGRAHIYLYEGKWKLKYDKYILEKEVDLIIRELRDGQKLPFTDKLAKAKRVVELLEARIALDKTD